MTTLTSAINTSFTPAVGTFNVQSSGGDARLERRNTPGASWVTAGIVMSGYAYVVDNSVESTDYQFVALSGTPAVQADQ